MKEISVQDLKQLKDGDFDYQLIDVREPGEYEMAQIGGELIPMATILDNLDRISRDKKVVLHCRSGKRSGQVLQYLEKNHKFENLHNLKGGLIAWAKEIDPSLTII